MDKWLILELENLVVPANKEVKKQHKIINNYSSTSMEPMERTPKGQTFKNLSKIKKCIFDYNLEYKINIHDSTALAKIK